MSGGLTDVAPLKVGHYTDREHATGCTVVLCEEGAVGGVDVRGSSPGTRETDVLRPDGQVDVVHAVVLSGGSAYGLATAGGVMRYLEERGIGHRVGEFIVPIVPAAILFDLGVITGAVRPGEKEGYEACLVASTGAVAEGSVGAGTGAVVGKALGRKRGIKGGVGTASLDLGDGLIVAALVAVNAIGGVVDPATGKILAGPRSEKGRLLDSVDIIMRRGLRPTPDAAAGANTTIGVVATNARLNKVQAGKLAQVAHDGLAIAIRPCHTIHDGDTIFALATGRVPGKPPMMRLVAAVPLVVAQAVVRAIKEAEGLGGIPAWQELKRQR